MATYNQIGYGARGSDVEKLQEMLNKNGAQLNVDGIYGTKTQSAVEEYQRKNGLAANGIADEQTLGKIYDLSAAQSSVPQAVQTPAQTAAQTPSYRYDSKSDNVYQQAMKQLEAAKENRPTYAGTFDEQLQQIYDRIMNREDFTFDLNSDPAWQQMKNQHVQQGQMAMMDTMGQAAALTGGYGNTYAQRAGQQAYQQHLQTLTDQIPELYQMALNRYSQEGDRLREQFAMTGELAADEYGKYQDAEARYWQGVDRAQAEADTAYDRGQSAWYTEQQLQQQADDTAYARQQDAYTKQQNAYDRLASLITSTGYNPTQEELTAAGMSAAQAAAYTKYYNDQNTPKYTGRYVQSVTEDTYDNGGVATSAIKQMQEKIGVSADGKWGDESRKAAKEQYGIDDPAALYKHFVGLSFAADGKSYDSQERYKQAQKSISAIANDVNEMVAAGRSTKDIRAYINAARDDGLVSDVQYQSLMNLAKIAYH